MTDIDDKLNGVEYSEDAGCAFELFFILITFLIMVAVSSPCWLLWAIRGDIP
jgi:hypothetical protein